MADSWGMSLDTRPPALPHMTPRGRVLGVLAAAACLVMLGTLAMAAHRERLHARQSVERTLEVLAALRGASGHIAEAQSHQRGFLLTRDRQFLRAYEIAEAESVEQLVRLRDLLTDPDASTLARQLQDIARGEFADLDEELAGGARSMAGEVISAPAHLRVQRRTESVVRLLEAREHSLLTSREIRADRASTAVNLMAGILVLLTAMSVAVSVWSLHRARQLERFVTVCAWSNEVKVGERWVSLTEYLTGQAGMRVSHGISPKELARIEAELAEKAENT